MGTFTSQGKTITFERFAPHVSGRHPAIVLVHGADGLQVTMFNAWYNTYARMLQQAGYDVFLIHYFDSTGSNGGVGRMGTLRNRLQPGSARDAGRMGIVRNFVPWVQTIKDAVTYVAQQPDIHANHIGLLGFSLGSSVALSLATRDPRIAAIAEFFGLLPPPAAATMTRMPPTLILHGDRDPLVPVQAAYSLEKLLKAKQVPYEMKIYTGQGHGFLGAAQADSLRRTRAFFDKYLRS